MLKAKSIVRPVTKEFKISNCGFYHLPADDFVKSQWQTRTKSLLFLIYRCCIAAFYLGVFIYSLTYGFSSGKYFIYLTNWGLCLCTATTMLGAILVFIWYLHPEYANRLKDSDEMPICFKIYWALHIITLTLSMSITIIYWAVLYGGSHDMNALNILSHAFNSILMFLDMWIVAYPVRLLHIFVPIGFGLIYAVFSVIYYAAGGLDPVGNPYIYPILDWRDGGQSVGTVIGVAVLCGALYVFIFFMYKLRVFIYKRCNRKQVFESSGVSSQLPNSPPVTLQSNRISMALGDYGHENLGFSKNSEKVEV